MNTCTVSPSIGEHSVGIRTLSGVPGNDNINGVLQKTIPLN